MTDLKIGVGLPTLDHAQLQALGAGGIATAAQHAEAVGLDFVGVPDVLIGDGTFALEGVVALTVAASATRAVHLDFGVLSLPTRPVAMLAAQVQTLQYVSGNRVRLGVGSGGFSGSPFWRAIGAPEKRRGHLVDAALQILPQLIAGEPSRLDNVPGQRVLTLAPGTPVPPILIGGGANDTALRRTVAYGDLWLPSALTTTQVSTAAARLHDLAAEQGRQTPGIHLGVHTVLGDDTTDRRSDSDAMIRKLSDFFEMTSEEVADVTIIGGPQEAADRLSAYAEAGVTELDIGVGGRDYIHQIELIAEARSLL